MIILTTGNSASAGAAATTSVQMPFDGYITGIDLSLMGVSGTGQVQAEVTLSEEITVPSTIYSPKRLTHLGVISPGASNRFVPQCQYVAAMTPIYVNVYSAVVGNYVHAAIHVVPITDKDRNVSKFPEPRGSEDPFETSPQPSVALTSPINAIIDAVEKSEKEKLKKRVLRSDQALECCERQVSRLNVEMGALMSGLYHALTTAKRGDYVALFPAIGASAAARTVATVEVVSEAALATALVGGAALLGTGVYFFNLGEQRGSIDTLAMVQEAIGTYFAVRTRTKTKVGSCLECIERRLLSQKHPRKRETVKGLLRRL